MKKMINQELIPEARMVDFKKIFIKCVFISVTLGILSCKSKTDSILLESNKLSNEIYIKEIKLLKSIFELKLREEPIKYKEAIDKISILENGIKNINEKDSINKQKQFIAEFKKIVRTIFKEDCRLLSLKYDGNNRNIFLSIVKNDINRVSYKVYRDLYLSYTSMAF
ncbi:hypothetical protein [Tenacibaculum jejuense]|uniref:Uncharacterized protein n=1 Tax=Tenacibaculum jejuense TaxID=584609 RepID=A0A238UGF9_9FLAO|nr:hypothetical protein [Tenacibaculum jejuense]SNR17628.1 protein of unknown function [Tenacibaculum jejuense]